MAPNLSMFNLDVLPSRASVLVDIDGDNRMIRFQAALLDARQDVVIREFPWTRWYNMRELPVELKWDELVGENNE